MKTTATHPARAISLQGGPEEVAARLRGCRGFVWLDSSGHSGKNCVSLLAAEPVAVLEGHISEPAALRTTLAGMSGGVMRSDLGLPGPGLLGTVEFDGSFRFGVYPEVLVFDHARERWFEHGSLSGRLPRAAVESTVPPLNFQPQWTREGFTAAVQRALGYIAAGDIYQVNLAQPFAAPWPAGADAFGYYQRLRAFSPAPHAAFLDQGVRQVMSASPELFLRLSGRTVRTRPIKGTRPRRRDPQEDERSAYELLTSAKEIAELIMITDLERNDLGQVCEFGTVAVTELLKLERFEQVFHLVSTVEGQLRADIDHLGALAACFPGGSISGAPKKRALEIIAELEPFPRGLFTGAIGHLGANGESQFSIAIRTAVAEGETVHFHTGAGIVADSLPEKEWEETWHKASTLLGAATWRGAADAPGASPAN